MVGMTISRPMGGIRGKDRINRLRKPKGKGSKSNGPTWQEWQLANSWEEQEVKIR